jgi:hypothetical protein
MTSKSNRNNVSVGVVLILVVFLLVLYRPGSPETPTSTTTQSCTRQVCTTGAVVSPSGVVTATFTDQGASAVSGVFVAEADQATNCGPVVNGVVCHYWSDSYSPVLTLQPGLPASYSVGTGEQGVVWSTSDCSWCTWNGALVSGAEYFVVVYFFSCWPSTTCLSLSDGTFANPAPFAYGGVTLNVQQQVIAGAQISGSGITYSQEGEGLYSGSATTQPGVLSP